MAFLIGEAFDYNNVIRQVRALCQRHPRVSKSDQFSTTSGVTITGTGTGFLYVACNSGALLNFYRATCTLGGADGVATFNVRRDPAGANENLGTLTAGVRFINATLGELILRTTTNWAINDTVEFTLVAGGIPSADAWTQSRFTEGAADGNGDFTTEWLAVAPSVGGGDTYHLGMQSQFNNPADRYNIELRGADGYEGSSAFGAQPNFSPACYVLLRDAPMLFWAVANGDRTTAVVRAGSTYQWIHLGVIGVFGTPGNHPKPILVGGMSTQSTDNTSSTATGHSAFWDACDRGSSLGGACKFRWVDGTWLDFFNRRNSDYSNIFGKSRITWPYAGIGGSGGTNSAMRDNTFMSVVIQRPGGNYELLPITLCITAPQNAVIGDIYGVKAVTGFGANSEDKVIDGGNTYFLFQNGFRTARESFAVLQML